MVEIKNKEILKDQNKKHITIYRFNFIKNKLHFEEFVDISLIYSILFKSEYEYIAYNYEEFLNLILNCLDYSDNVAIVNNQFVTTFNHIEDKSLNQFLIKNIKKNISNAKQLLIASHF